MKGGYCNDPDEVMVAHYIVEAIEVLRNQNLLMLDISYLRKRNREFLVCPVKE
jgi:hypothetical protein